MKGSVRSSLYSSIPNHALSICIPSDPKSCPDLLIPWVPALSFRFLALPAAGFVVDTLHCPPQALHWCLCPPQAYLHVGLSGAPAMCSHFKGFCFPPSQPASQLGCVRPASKAPTSCLACVPPTPAAASLLCFWQKACWGVCGGVPSPWPLFSLLHQLTAKYPWGLGREGFSLIFFSNGNNSTTCQRDFFMHLFRGVDFVPSFFPSLLDALEMGSFVSLAGLVWSGLVRRAAWVPEPNIRYLGRDCPAHWLCDFQDSADPLWAS